MKYLELKNKWFIWPLFLLLFSYIVLRAWFVQPILDELGTLYWYIETGQIIGGSAVMDTNNHFLNTFVARWMYQLFGDHFFGFRILAIASFPLYFFATRNFIQRNIQKQTAWIVFIALNTIPWVTDYFGFCRGYAPSLAFFFTSFCVFQNWKERGNWKTLALFILLLILTLFSNLSLLIPVFILFSYSILVWIVNRKQFTGSKQTIALFLAFLAFLVPVYIYLSKLKKAGALWWGSKDGLWLVTGKSLSKNVFFTEHIVWKYIFIALFVLVLTLLVFSLIRQNFKQFLFNEKTWVSVVFGGSVIAAVVMAVFMDVNYPMDRVGMYLVPLFILVLGITLSENKILRWLLLALLWFPISFVAKLNLYTSVFSPEDRIHPEFYVAIKNTVKDGEQFSSDYVMHAIYAYSARQDKEQHLLTEFYGDTLALGTYHLSWMGNAPSPNYIPVLKDKYTVTTLFKRIKEPKRILIKDTVIRSVTSKELCIPLFELKLNKNITLVQTDVQGTVNLEKPFLGLNLTHEIFEKDSVARFLQPTRFDWYFGSKSMYKFRVPNQPLVINPTDETLLISMRNNGFQNVILRNVRIKIYAVEP